MKNQNHIIVFICLFVLQIFFLSAQIGPVQWSMTYGGSNPEDVKAGSVLQTSDSCFVFCSATSSDNTGDVGPLINNPTELWIVKTNSTGVIQWKTLLGGNSFDYARSVIEAGNFLYVSASTYSSNAGVNYHGASDGVLVKIDKATGTIIWSKCYGGSSYDFFEKVINSKDGNLVLVGSTLSSGSGNVPTSNGQKDGWLIKITPTGAVIWSKTFGGTGNDELFGLCENAADSSLVTVGYTYSSTIGTATNSGGVDGYALKVSSSGNIVWQNLYGGTGDDYFYDAISSKTLVIVGTTTSTAIPSHHGGSDAWAVIVDNNTGSLTNQKAIGGTGNDGLDNVSADGSDILINITSSSLVSGDIVGTPKGGFDMVLMKISVTNLSIIWQQRIGGSDHEYGTNLIKTLDGGHAACGQTKSSSNGDVPLNHGDWDVWLIKFQPEQPLSINELQISGRVAVNNVKLWWAEDLFSNTQEIERSSAEDFSGDVLTFSVDNNSFVDTEPVPGKNYYRLKKMEANGASYYSNTLVFEFLEKIQIKTDGYGFLAIENLPPEGGTVSIYDMNGRILFVQRMQIGENIDVSSYAKGVYVIEIKKTGEVIYSEKVLLR